MICATRKTILARLVEVILEVLVYLGAALGGLNHHKADGTIVYGTLIAQQFPVYAALIVTDIYAVDIITLGITDLAIKGLPTQTIGRYKEIIEKPNVESGNRKTAYPPSPIGQSL